MKISTLLVADYAKIDPADGKLDVLGSFRQIYSRNFPTSLRRICLVAVIERELGDSSESYQLNITWKDADGDVNGFTEFMFDLPEDTQALPGEFCLIHELNGPKFTKPGTYSFCVSVGESGAVACKTIEVIERGV